MSLTSAAFLLAFAAGLGLAVFKHPRYGLYTYIAVFYLHPPSRWWGEMLPDLRWSLLAAVVTLAASWRLPATPGRTSWLGTTPGRALVLFTGWLWVQNFWALEPELHFEATTLFTKYVLLYYLIYRLVVTPEDISRLLLVHLLGCAFLGWLAFSTDVSGRLEGVGGPGIDEANAFAMQMGTGVVAGAMICLAMRGYRRWGAIIALPFILNGVILSGSRGGFLALVAGGLVLWYLKPLQHRKLFYAFAILGVALFASLTHDMFWERMGTLGAGIRRDEQAADVSALSRYVVVEAQLRMAADYPHGTGHRGTATLSPRFIEERFLSGAEEGAERQRSSHNTFMTALVEQGIPGAIWYVWVFAWVALTVIKLKRSRLTQDSEQRAMLAAIAAGLAVVFVAGVFVDYIKTEVQIWLWALLATMLSSAREVVAPDRSTSSARRRLPAENARPVVIRASSSSSR